MGLVKNKQVGEKFMRMKDACENKMLYNVLVCFNDSEVANKIYLEKVQLI